MAETARCVSDIRSIFLYYTSFTHFLQVLCFYNPQICALNHAFFFTSVLTLWFMLSIYFPKSHTACHISLSHSSTSLSCLYRRLICIRHITDTPIIPPTIVPQINRIIFIPTSISSKRVLGIFP